MEDKEKRISVNTTGMANCSVTNDNTGLSYSKLPHVTGNLYNRIALNFEPYINKNYSVSLEEIESLIAKEEYAKVGKKMTICLLTLKNGHEIIGTSGVVDHRKYDINIGKKFARERAIEQMWGLLGYMKQVEMHNDMGK